MFTWFKRRYLVVQYDRSTGVHSIIRRCWTHQGAKFVATAREIAHLDECHWQEIDRYRWQVANMGRTAK